VGDRAEGIGHRTPPRAVLRTAAFGGCGRKRTRAQARGVRAGVTAPNKHRASRNEGDHRTPHGFMASTSDTGWSLYPKPFDDPTEVTKQNIAPGHVVKAGRGKILVLCFKFGRSAARPHPNNPQSKRLLYLKKRKHTSTKPPSVWFEKRHNCIGKTYLWNEIANPFKTQCSSLIPPQKGQRLPLYEFLFTAIWGKMMESIQNTLSDDLPPPYQTRCPIRQNGFTGAETNRWLGLGLGSGIELRLRLGLG